MKFIFDGSYTTFDGHEFMFGKPVEVTGAGTIEKLKKDPRFMVADDYNAERFEGGPSTLGKIGEPLEFKAKLCPKCGVKPAKHFHVINCTGQR